MLISIVIPVYNEKHTVEEIIKKIQTVQINKEIIIVDDYSTDSTRDILKKYENNSSIKIILHDQNKGKGAAIRTAINHITGEIVIIQDADLEYDPNDYPNLLAPILEGKADVVYGSRFMGGGPHRVHLFWHYLGNKFLTLMSNFFTNLNLSDMETCYKVFKTEVIKSINLKQDRFGIEPEITAKIAKKKYRIYETGISYYGRNYDEGKKITWKDGLKAIYCIIRYGIFK